MKMTPFIRSALAAAALGFIAASASAADFIFTGNIDNNGVAGQSFSGTFSYDVPAKDGEALLTKFSFTFGGQTYTLTDAVSAPSVWFEAGQPSWFQYGAQLNGATLELASIDFAQGMLTYTDAAQNFSAGSFTISAVPEPESYALMLGGLGLVGWMARRRKA